jgi:hypothetical protein
VIAAAGDVACDPGDPAFNGGSGSPTNCRELYTSNLLTDTTLFPALDGVLAVGDLQYEDGAYSKFLSSYDPSWGRIKSVTHPAIGNHEYETGSATGYFQYFGAVAGDPTTGYYSFDIGTWHLIALNSNCARIGGCGLSSPEGKWLRSDLATHSAACTLAYWHHALFSSGPNGDNHFVKPFWQQLYQAHADVVINGHDHDYERFAPQTPGGAADPAHGIREFVVGTGGKSHFSFTSVQPNSEVRNSDTFGVLKLTLHPTSYDWTFVPEAGKTFTDSGSGACQ